MSVSGTWQAGFRSSDRFFLAISESRTLSCAAFLTCRKTSHISASSKFPTSYRNKLIPLAEISLNCLLPWQLHPAIFAYHGLAGAPFDFCAHLIAPVGTSILIHEAPKTCSTWAGHDVPSYYLGPALTHYRTHHVFVTATSAPRVTDTVAWFPETDITPPPPNATEMLIAAI